jgi:hypothetical protein
MKNKNLRTNQGSRKSCQYLIVAELLLVLVVEPVLPVLVQMAQNQIGYNPRTLYAVESRPGMNFGPAFHGLIK